jgi:hypothetical protein
LRNSKVADLSHSNLSYYTLQLVNIIFVRARRRGEKRSSGYATPKVRVLPNGCHRFLEDSNGGPLAELDELTICDRRER